MAVFIDFRIGAPGMQANATRALRLAKKFFKHALTGNRRLRRFVKEGIRESSRSLAWVRADPPRFGRWLFRSRRDDSILGPIFSLPLVAVVHNEETAACKWESFRGSQACGHRFSNLVPLCSLRFWR